MEVTNIYTDGGCSPNPGPGGWGAVIVHPGGGREELSGAADKTTNNQMEITAAIEALRALEKPSRVLITTDSQYLKKGITNWIRGWRKKGWVTKDGNPVKNQELWKSLDREISRHVVSWAWTRGHSGDELNERADALARAGIPRQPLPTDDPEAVHIFCGASYSGKSREGGFGIVLRFRETRKEHSGRVPNATANQMHILAAVEGLSALKRRSRVRLYTNSDYARDGATRWIPGWRRRGWQNSTGQPVSHRPLWERLDALQRQHDVTWHVVDRSGAPPKEMEDAKELSGTALRGEPPRARPPTS